MDCRDIQELVYIYAAGELDSERQSDLEAHLSKCEECKAASADSRRYISALENYLKWVEPSDSFQEQVWNEIQQSAAERKENTTGQTSGTPLLRVLKSRVTKIAALFIFALAIFLLWQPGPPPPEVLGQIQVIKKGFEVTVFNKDLGLIKDMRQIVNLKPGVNELRFQDVPARLDPTSVKFESLTDPEGCKVLEQNYEYDLVSKSKLLEKYIDKEIVIEEFSKEKGVTQKKGILVSTQGAISVKIGDKVYVNPKGVIVLPELPEGLITRPSLHWKLYTERESRHETVVSYLTRGMSWRADYIIVLKGNEEFDLKGWVTINNRSGATYKDAKLKLIAGDVHLPPDKIPMLYFLFGRRVSSTGAQPGPTFVEKEFFEYHLYTLQHTATLKDRQIKQISLFEAFGARGKRTYVYDGQQMGKKVQASLEFKNEESNHLGRPLPEGRVRVMKTDTDGEPEMIGEDNIDHTPKDEKVVIRLGSTFDIVGERKLLDYKRTGRREERTVEIRLRNHKEETATVLVHEHLSGDWEIVRSSHEYRKVEAREIEFEVPVASGDEEVITYTWIRTL